MPVDNDASNDFTPRPAVPREYVDTANLVEAVSGKRPQYQYDINAGQWVLYSAAETGIWPTAYGYLRGEAGRGGAVTMLVRVEDQQDSDRPGGVWLHFEGYFGELQIRLDAEDARLWLKLLKKAAKKLSR